MKTTPVTGKAEPPGRGALNISETPVTDKEEPPGRGALNVSEWNDWRWQLSHRITTKEALKEWLVLTSEEIEAIDEEGGLPFAVTPYFASLADPIDPACPIRRQFVPDPREGNFNRSDLSDPCGEEKHSVYPWLVHRYPDRVLLLATNDCATFCRHCTRRRIVGRQHRSIDRTMIDLTVDYLVSHPEVRDVLISGGDPLLLTDQALERVLEAVHKIPSIEIVRLGTRVPVTLPQRITPELVQMLRRFHPLWINIHFNHPREITGECAEACARLADAGIPLGSQTVLLREINDRPETMKELCRKLLSIRVRPYYIYQCDLAPGTSHFRTPVQSGLKIMEKLRGHTSGLAVPTFVIDAPGGGGKIPVAPNYVINLDQNKVLLRNWENRLFELPQVREKKPSCVRSRLERSDFR